MGCEGYTLVVPSGQYNDYPEWKIAIISEHPHDDLLGLSTDCMHVYSSFFTMDVGGGEPQWDSSDKEINVQNMS